ncbi:hypothetical protein JI667_12755 [Bacillus sp. NTK074B]|uniref:hypothetical protein n=1 Tax=Bacillus sp. NTK074B TaxID=2802174 RepID=UPI001A8D9412|nr:hypothetical protein [Bacillus sp. NTK074B]
MSNDIFFSIIPLLTLLIYLAPVVFIIWFLLRFLKIQTEKNEILRSIDKKLNKLGN